MTQKDKLFLRRIGVALEDECEHCGTDACVSWDAYAAALDTLKHHRQRADLTQSRLARMTLLCGLAITALLAVALRLVWLGFSR